MDGLFIALLVITLLAVVYVLLLLNDYLQLTIKYNNLIEECICLIK